MKKTFLLFMFAFTTLNLVLAQTCGVSDYTTANTVSYGDETMQGQTFALTCGASLTAVKFGTQTNNGSAVVTATIKTSACGGTTLATKSKTGVTAGSNTITFDAAVSLTQGTTYFLEFTGTGTTLIRSNSGNPYSGGKIYFSRPAGQGGACQSDATYELAFALVFTSLPIELVQFDVQTTEGGKNYLTWATGNEVNNHSFDIERSRDGVNFTTIGNVKAQGKAANYSFVDNTPLSNTSYYRLKSMDNDQTFEYSKVISVQNGKAKGGIKIYPTATKDAITVDNNGLSVESVTIFNQVGQLVFTAKQVNQVNLSGLPSGMYFVQVQAGSERVTEKVFKQ